MVQERAPINDFIITISSICLFFFAYQYIFQYMLWKQYQMEQKAIVVKNLLLEASQNDIQFDYQGQRINIESQKSSLYSNNQPSIIQFSLKFDNRIASLEYFAIQKNRKNIVVNSIKKQIKPRQIKDYSKRQDDFSKKYSSKMKKLSRHIIQEKLEQTLQNSDQFEQTYKVNFRDTKDILKNTAFCIQSYRQNYRDFEQFAKNHKEIAEDKDVLYLKFCYKSEQDEIQKL